MKLKPTSIIDGCKRLFFPVPKEQKAAFSAHTISDILYKSCAVHLISALLQALNIFIVLSRIKNNPTFIPTPADRSLLFVQVLALFISGTSLVLFLILRKGKAIAKLDVIFYVATILLMMTQGFLSRYEFHAVNQFFRLIIYSVVFATLVNYAPGKGFFVIMSGYIVFMFSGSFFIAYPPQFYALVGIPTDVHSRFMESYAGQNLVFALVLCMSIFVINYRKAHRDFLFNAERNKLTDQLDNANKQLLESSIKDALTSLNNRRALDEYAAHVWKECCSHGDKLSVMMLDADYFKAYNDGFGHQAGDDALRTIAEVLKRNFSFMRGMLARYGGEEFIAVIPGMDESDVLSTAEKIRAEVESLGIANPIPANRHNVLTVSIGVYTGNAKETDSMDRCIRLADDALYRAKSKGRNTVIADK